MSRLHALHGLARLLALASGLLAVSCSEPTTGGQHIQVATRLAGDVEAGQSFVNGLGWTLRLDAARVAFEHLYFVTGEPVGGVSRFLDWLVPSAFAHPGHYDSGDVLAELNERVELDLLARPLLLAPRDAVTGVARSAVVSFGALEDEPALGGSDAESGVAVFVEGRAASQEMAVRFRVDVTTAELANPASDLPEVSGCPFEGKLSADGVVQGTVSTRVWLDQVDFSGLDGAEAEPVVLERGSTAHNAFVRGVRKALAYSFSYERH